MARLRADVRGVVRQYGVDLALFLEERGGVGDSLGGRRAKQATVFADPAIEGGDLAVDQAR